jgi:HSP20 family protein
MGHKHLPSFFSQFTTPFDIFEDEEGWHFPLKESSNLTLSEDKNNFYVEAALPGLKPEEIEISLEKNVLWIKGQKKEEEKDKKYYRKASSSFSYRVVIPVEIDEKKDIEATYKDGIMKVAFQKAAASKPQKITIKKQ